MRREERFYPGARYSAQPGIGTEELVRRSEVLLGQCKACRYCQGIQEITFLQVRIDENVECSLVEPGDRSFIIFRGDGRCTRYAPRLRLVTERPAHVQK